MEQHGRRRSIYTTPSRMIGAVLVGSALSLSGAAYQGVFKNPLVAPDLLGVSSGACRCISGNLLHLNSFGVQAMAFVAGIFGGWTYFIYSAPDKEYEYDDVGIVRIIVKGIMDSVMESLNMLQIRRQNCSLLLTGSWAV